MSETEGAAAPATEQAQPAPAVTEPATPKESIRDVDAPQENADQPKATETEQPAPEGDEPANDEPKKLTRNQRLQRKAARLSTMVAEQAAELEKLRQASSKSDAESEPKEADYNGDWAKFQADHTAWTVTKNIKGVLSEQQLQQRQAAVQEKVQEATEDFLERVEAIKTSVPDYDAAFEAFAARGGKFADHVIEEIRDSEKGPMLAYHLAKNPHVAAELNAMSPRDAAREMGRLEAKVALPQRKIQTQAPAPLSALKGGSAPTADIHALAKSDNVDAYVAARRAQQKASA